MTDGLYFTIFFLQTILAAIIAFISLYDFKNRDKSARLIGILLLCSFLCNALGYVLVVLLNLNPNFAGSLYTLIFIIIVTALYNHNARGKHSKWYITTCLVVLAFSALNFLFLQKNPGASYNKLLVSFVVTAYCLFYFYRLIVERPTADIRKLPMFWYTAGFLLYHAGTVFLFAFFDYLVHVLHNDMVTYWGFHNTLNIIEHLIILIGLYFNIGTHPTAVTKVN